MMQTNRERAEAFAAVLDCARELGCVDGEDPYIDIVDLLANMRHFCHQGDIDFYAANESADHHFHEELDEEEGE